ncbi:MAG: YceI family protein [Daejeonella sp.]
MIQKNCSLKVSGKTNVNKFSCVINNYTKLDTITHSKSSIEPLKLTGSLQLDILDFDCNDPIMTKDLRKSLKHKEFPRMIIRFISLSRYPKFKEKPDHLTGIVAIELAGVTKHFEVNYLFQQDGHSTARLVGTRKVNFSDFNLTVPKKLAGIIKAGNELNVEFNLRFRIIE